MRRYYAGIGSRRAGEYEQAFATHVARELRLRDWTLRSGHADGMDQAFERGAEGQAEIYLPWQSFRSSAVIHPAAVAQARPTLAAIRLAEDFHPAWEACSDEARHLHARNMHIICGPDLLTPVKFVVCWTPEGGIDGAGSGGTNFAIGVARYFEIPVFNFARDEHKSRLRGLVEDHSRA